MGSFLSIIKALPVIANFLKTIVSLYEQWQVKSIEKHYDKKKKVKSILAKQIEKATNDEERKKLARQLANLNNS